MRGRSLKTGRLNPFLRGEAQARGHTETPPVAILVFVGRRQLPQRAPRPRPGAAVPRGARTAERGGSEPWPIQRQPGSSRRGGSAARRAP